MNVECILLVKKYQISCHAPEKKNYIQHQNIQNPFFIIIYTIVDIYFNFETVI